MAVGGRGEVGVGVGVSWMLTAEGVAKSGRSSNPFRTY